MVKRVLRMTCSAQMHTKLDARYWIPDTRRMKDENRASRIGHPVRGYTLIELMVVIVVVALMAFMVQIHLFGMLRKATFRAQVQEFVSTMQMAASAAGESNRRYEVIIDIPAQGYMLREIRNPDLSQVSEEDIIIENIFSENCRVAYVMFDDGDDTRNNRDGDTTNNRAKFRAGHSGWEYGGKIVLLDENEQPYSIVVNRLNRMITLEQGDVGLLTPKTKDEVLF